MNQYLIYSRRRIFEYLTLKNTDLLNPSKKKCRGPAREEQSLSSVCTVEKLVACLDFLAHSFIFFQLSYVGLVHGTMGEMQEI